MTRDAAQVPDLLVVWEWRYDREFLELIERRCVERGLECASFARDQIATVAEHLRAWPRAPRLILDRASDVFPELVALLCELERRGARVVNHPQRMIWCRDKATMHLELIAAGVEVPHAVILSREDCGEDPLVMPPAAERLGSPFVIKPAEGGGGEGVVLDATDLEEVRAYFDQYGCDKVVLQRLIEPRLIAGRRAWFRVFWVLGRVLPCWWDDRTHEYAELGPGEQIELGLEGLSEITGLIAGRSGMDLFTTEIAVDDGGAMVVVDFVNEMPDLRPESRHVDGVPQAVVESVADALVDLASTSAAGTCRV